MRLAHRLLVSASVLAVVASSWVAHAEVIYKYRDQARRRDVFVNQPDQIPEQYRQQSQRVVSDGMLARSSEDSEEGRPRGTVIFGRQESSSRLGLARAALGEVLRVGPHSSAVTLALTKVLDTTLVLSGRPPLDAREGARLKQLTRWWLWAGLMSGCLYFVVWLAVLAHAFASSHPGWAALVLLFHLPGVVYLGLHIDPRHRWLKFVAWFGQCAPYLVGVLAAWALRDWVHATLSARGG